MTTSNSIVYNEDFIDLATDALSLIGAIAAGEAPTSADLLLANHTVNKMLKAWQAQGIHLWTEEEGTIYLVNGQAQYNLAVGASYSNASDGSGTPVETTLSSTGSGTTIQVTNTTGMSVNDTIGIVLNTNVLFWTTITSVSNNTVGLNSSLSGQANTGNCVFSYPTQLARPLSIQAARVRDASGFDRVLWIKPRADYDRIANKNIIGSPNILFYTPQMVFGSAFLWPTPNLVSDRIKITYLRPIQDIVSSTDTFDLPQEWLECITFNLAVRLAPSYGINLSSGGISGNPDILRMAAQFLDDLKAWDSEQPYLQYVPNYRYTR